MRGERIPLLAELLEIIVYIGGELALAEFVCLGKDDAEGDVALAQPLHEFKIYLLRLMAAVNEHEEVRELATLKDIARDHLLELGPLGLAALGESVAGQVHDVPLVVDEEMVDEQCFARRGRSLGEALLRRQHIDEAGFSDVGTSNESVLWLFVCWTLVSIGAADDKIC